MTNEQCPICGAASVDSLMCHADTLRLEKELGDVASIVGELDVTLSRQARIGSGGKGGLASEKNPVHLGAMQAHDDLENTLTTWIRDIDATWRPEKDRILTLRAAAQPFIGPFHNDCSHRSCERMRIRFVEKAPPVMSQVAAFLLSRIPEIRKHPAVEELVDEVTDAIRTARRAVDRPADRQYLGQCLVETPDEEGHGVTCYEELYASHGACELTCKVCGMTHEVAERRAWLLKRAEDMIVSIKDASTYLGEVGEIRVTEASIRGYLHRGKIGYRAPVEAKRIRLGDLLEVVLDEGERKSA